MIKVQDAREKTAYVTLHELHVMLFSLTNAPAVMGLNPRYRLEFVIEHIDDIMINNRGTSWPENGKTDWNGIESL